MRMRTAAAMILTVSVLLPLTAAGADINGDGGERILLPLAFVPDTEGGDPVPGAFGTIWTGEVWVESRNTVHVQWGNCNTFTCAPLQPLSITRLAAPIGLRPELGHVLEVNADQAQRLTFSNRMYERTMKSQPRGIDIPVVREGEFFSTPKMFLAVPTGVGVRVGIRLYDPWAFKPFLPAGPALESLTVEAVDELLNALGTTTVRTVVPVSETSTDLSRPGFVGLLDLAQLFPAINARPRIHLRVTPNPAGAQYWGMVSVTDNETQTVSIITAQ